jgi:hypothetical protein
MEGPSATRRRAEALFSLSLGWRGRLLVRVMRLLAFRSPIRSVGL